MIFDVGVDIEEHQRFLKYLDSEKSKYLLSVYSQKEIDNYQKFKSHLCFAIGFSCKEAFFKAFGETWANSPMQWTDIEIFFKSNPTHKNAEVIFSGYAKTLINNNKLQISPEFNYKIMPTSVLFEATLLSIV